MFQYISGMSSPMIRSYLVRRKYVVQLNEAQFNLDGNNQNKEISILSDSQVAIRDFNSYKIYSTMLWDCSKKLNKLDRNKKVTILWVVPKETISCLRKAHLRLSVRNPSVDSEIICMIHQEIIKKEEEAKRATL